MSDERWGLDHPEFWWRPLEARMADFAVMREAGPFTPASIADMPMEAMEFYGSFIAMDDPRHWRQRNIVARSFTPKALQGVLDSVETVCTEVIDAMCEQGEVDLVAPSPSRFRSWSSAT